MANEAAAEQFVRDITAPPRVEGDSVGVEAERIINGPRRDAYGPVEESFQKIATGWSLILGVEVTPQQVALMMVVMKVLRETGGQHHRDNLVDIIGYTLLLEKLTS